MNLIILITIFFNNYFSLINGNKGAGSFDTNRPNIVFILMDDLGWHDISINGGQFPTPNIDKLYSESISLERHYIHLMCSPSRTQFLTGRYAMRQGIGKMLPWDYTEIGGIPVGQPTVANWLKEVGGYTTYAVGKWHCGYATQALTPTHRGFDHFFGFYQGAIHYDNTKYIDIKFGESNHFDFWEDGREVAITAQDDQFNTMHLYRDKVIDYINDPFRVKYQPFYMYVPLQTIHGPLNRVHDYEKQCDDILGGNIARRSKYCQNILLTDDVIGDIIKELKHTEQWKNTLFILTTDNGADIANKGCNFPLRGTKGTLFDGNIRTVALIGGGVIPNKQRGTLRDSLFSSLDWTPTLLHFAHVLNEIKFEDRTWDGIDQYQLLTKGVGDVKDKNVRDHIVLNIGLRNLESASIVFKYEDSLYKYIAQDESIDQWTYKRDDGWCVPQLNGNWDMVMDDEISQAQHVDNKYLFDLTYDVSERTNLLQLNDDQSFDNNVDLIRYAKNILQKYTSHPLYSEHLSFLWNRLPIGDPTLLGDGSFISPFLTEREYYKHLSHGFAKIEEEYQTEMMDAYENNNEFNAYLPYTKKLKKLYFHKWSPPVYIKKGHIWYIYAICGIVIVALLVIIIVSVARYRHFKSIYDEERNGGYKIIKNKTTADHDTTFIPQQQNKTNNNNYTGISDHDINATTALLIND